MISGSWLKRIVAMFISTVSVGPVCKVNSIVKINRIVIYAIKELTKTLRPSLKFHSFLFKINRCSGTSFLFVKINPVFLWGCLSWKTSFWSGTFSNLVSHIGHCSNIVEVIIDPHPEHFRDIFFVSFTFGADICFLNVSIRYF